MTASPSTAAASPATQTRAARGSPRPIIRVALFDPAQVHPPVVAELRDRPGAASFFDMPAAAAARTAAHRPTRLTDTDLALVIDPAVGVKAACVGGEATGLADEADEAVLNDMLAALEADSICAVIMTRRPARFAGLAPCCAVLSPDESADTIRGALAALAAAAPAIRRLQVDRNHIRHVGENVQAYFAAMDCELRLASRLQREFLVPSGLRFGPIGFSTLFRPANWVSGDVYDIQRLDEEHVAFYLADAMGHGVAAGLLTMYVRRAIQPKRIMLSGYELIPPGEVLQRLNDQFCDQKLPDPHFITAIYGLVNLKSFRLDYAVAGHPPALRIAPGGDIAELPGEGSILGLGAGQTYETHSTHLLPGERIVIYSDGLEPAIIRERRAAPEQPVWADAVGDTLRGPADQLAQQLFDRVDRTPGSLRHADDVSAIILDIDLH